MTLRIKSQVDFLAGLMFTILGVAFTLLSLRYRLGSAGSMGPGYFPMVLGLLLAVLGLIVLAASTTGEEEDALETINLRPVGLVTGAVALFGTFLVPLGLLVSSFMLIVLSALASKEFHWRYAVLTAIVMIVACYLMFVVGLGLPMPIWPRIR
ncbi:tripartite tricarboxylate transporter TctB family protein [Mesorhizobium sp. A556]